MEPASLRGIRMVVPDAAQGRAELLGRGVEASEVDPQAWGTFVYSADPDGNAWALQEMTAYA